MADENPDNPKPVVGRTWADLMATSQTGPKLDAAMAAIVDFMVNAPGRARDRITRLFTKVNAQLEASGVEPKAIPERVAIPVMEAVALEEREEIHDLWAKLLVASSRGDEVDYFLVLIVRQLDPDSARLLLACAHAVIRLAPNVKDVPRTIDPDLRNATELVQAVPDETARNLAIDRLVAIGLMHWVAKATGAMVPVPTGLGGALLMMLEPNSFSAPILLP